MNPASTMGMAVQPYARGALCQSFIGLATHTFHWMTLARQPNLVPGETAVTDFNLFRLWATHPLQVAIWRHSQRRESRSGADWEWWLGGPGGWVGFRVQAKKLDDSGVRYQHLFRSVRGQRQIDTLIDQARATGITPIYCFYNGLPGVLASWRASCSGTLPPQARGCTVASARSVRLLNSDELAQLAPVSAPWSDLVCCQPGAGLADAAAASATALDGQTVQPAGELPTYVRRAVLGEIRGLDDHLRSLDGIMVIEEPG
jgi:hypothetical protein